MLFQDAINALMEGQFVARESWNEAGDYLVLMPGMQSIWRILTKPNPNAGNWLPLMEDFIADDWKVVNRVRTVEAQPEA